MGLILCGVFDALPVGAAARVAEVMAANHDAARGAALAAAVQGGGWMLFSVCLVHSML